MNRKAFTIPEKAMFFIEYSGAVIIFENGKIDVGILLLQKFLLDAGKQLMAVTLTAQMRQNIDRGFAEDRVSPEDAKDLCLGKQSLFHRRLVEK